MTNLGVKRFIQDYEAYNRSLRIPHPYFQHIQYVKINSMIINRVIKKKHDTILDIGSGEGHLIHGLSAVSNGCVALDIESERLEKLCKRNPDIMCVQANVDFGLPFKGNTFNCIIASELLEHLNTPRRFYREVARVLRKKGTFIITTPNCENLTYKLIRRLPKSAATSLARRAGADLNLHPELVKDQELDRKNPHLHKVEGYSKSQLIALGKENGLKTVFCTSFGLAIPDSAYLRVPKSMTRFIVNKIEDHVPYALRHFIVYEN